MAEVRASIGTPSTTDFYGLGAPTLCAPIVVDSLTGNIYGFQTGLAGSGGAAGTVVNPGANFLSYKDEPIFYEDDMVFL